MPPLNQISPRLAIQNWLLHSASKPSDKQGSPQGCNRDAKVLKSGGSTRQQATGNDFPGQNQDRSEDFKSRNFSKARQEPSSRRSPWESGHDDESLPQRLGLYAPFRSFGRQSNDMDMDQHSISASARKRRRNIPSTSSDVEPANFKTHTELETNGCVHRSISLASADIAEMKETASDSNNSYSIHSRGRTQKVYGRKPRRKTREDRYDLKAGIVDEKPRKRKKRHHAWEREGKRRKKSGSGMMHDFSAKNIAPGRLTLKSTFTFGLFNNGRASSPVKRNGLPDLSFSEISFLKSKREKSNDPIKPKIKESRLKKHGDWDADAHISRYFVSSLSGPKTSKQPGRTDPESEYSSRGRTGRNEMPFELDKVSGEPYLGSGSPRVDLTSPVQNIERRANSQSPKPLSTRPPSLVSWSMSGALPHHDSIDRDIMNPSDDLPNARTILENNHQASIKVHSQQKPYDSVPLRRTVIHSSDTCKVPKFDEQQEPPRFGNALSKTMITDQARIPEPRAHRRGKAIFVRGPVSSGQEDSPNRDLQTPCDAAPENFPKYDISTTHSPRGSVRSRATNTMCLLEKSDNVDYGNPPLLSQMIHGIQDSTTECIYDNMEVLHNNVFESPIIVRARSFELQTDQPKEQLELGLIDYGPRINQYNDVDAWRADRSEGLDRLSTGLNNHEFYTTDTSTNHENPAQRRLQMRIFPNGGFDEHDNHWLGNGCSLASMHTNRLAGLENLDERLVACNPGNFPNHELGAIDDQGTDSRCGRNDSTEIFAGPSNSHDEQKTITTLHEIKYLPSHYPIKNQTILDADVGVDQPSLQENMDAGYASYLEDSHEHLLGWHQNNNRNNGRLLRGKRFFESFLPRYDTWYDTRNGAGNIGGTRQMVETLDIPGFWKPQKLY